MGNEDKVKKTDAQPKKYFNVLYMPMFLQVFLQVFRDEDNNMMKF